MAARRFSQHSCLVPLFKQLDNRPSQLCVITIMKWIPLRSRTASGAWIVVVEELCGTRSVVVVCSIGITKCLAIFVLLLATSSSSVVVSWAGSAGGWLAGGRRLLVWVVVQVQSRGNKAS